MKVNFYTEPWNNSLSIMFWEERNGRVYRAKPVKLEFVECPEGHSPEGPTIRIPHELSGAFMKALAEELDRHAVKTDSDHKIQGTLEAMKSHLSDLRQLLKLK